MVKYLHMLILSITLSTTSDFARSPQRENRPVCASKTRQDASTINRSTRNSAPPIFSFVYFFKIMAIISVPPPEAPTLNKMAELAAGSTIAQISSSTGCEVSGADIGNHFSAALNPTDISTLTQTVLIPKLFPRKINPSTSSAILIINVIFPGVVGIMALKTTAIPVTPPKEKLFGNLNTYTPTTRISVATVSTKYSSIVRFTRPAFLNIVFSSV